GVLADVVVATPEERDERRNGARVPDVPQRLGDGGVHPGSGAIGGVDVERGGERVDAGGIPQLAQRPGDDRTRLGALLRGQPGVEHRGEALVEALAGAKGVEDPDLLAGTLGRVELVLPVPRGARVL